jgi:hypothetical protein
MDRLAAKRAEEMAKLKEKIDNEVISKGTVQEGILAQELVDIDGHGRIDRPVVTALGGFLGQLIMVLQTVAKFYSRLDVPPKSRQSQARTPLQKGKDSDRKADVRESKSSIKKQDSEAKSHKSEVKDDSVVQEPEPEHQILSP